MELPARQAGRPKKEIGTMPRPVISQDIIDQVVYALRDDRATLLRCCTVSRSFLIPSRKQLFFYVEIGYSHRTNSLLIHVLSIHPEYLSYIRILRIRARGIEIFEKPSFVRLIEDLADRRVLQAFRLVVSCSWEALSVPIQAALVRLFQSPSLHTINSRGMCSHTFPVHVLGLATGLQHLNMRGHPRRSCRHRTVVSPMIPPLPSAASHGIYLESLEMILEPEADALVGYLSHPDCPLKITRLRELRIHSSYCLPTTATVLKGASQSLESLIWDINGVFGAHESSEDWFESS